MGVGPLAGRGPTPEQLRRWAAERDLLARLDEAAASDRVRVTVWIGFVLTCAAVIVVCVLVVLGSGGGSVPTSRTSATTATPAPPATP